MLRLSEISAKEPGVRLEPPDKSGSDTTSSRGGASSNGSVNADIIDLSPQVKNSETFHLKFKKNKRSHSILLSST